ncbi:ionotropic receptor 75a-like [Anabrus simplex]|uniref:ionotropic receptor 75a-like n=1 Tax=Anabrus simplex TaxID=316456 RepID=UPI0035A29699
MNALPLLLVVLWIWSAQGLHIPTAVRFIKDFLDFSNKAAPPSRVNAFVCWGNDNIKLIHGLSTNGVSASVFTKWEPLTVIQNPEPALFLLDMSCKYSDDLLRQASNLQGFTAPNHWLLLADHRETGSSLTERTMIASSRAENESSLHQTTVRMEEEAVTTSLPDLMSQEEGTVFPSDELVTCEKNCSQQLISLRHETENSILEHYKEVFQALNVFVDSQVLLVFQSSKEHYQLVEVYRQGPQEHAIFTNTGDWTLQSGVRWKVDLALSVRRSNLNQTLLKAAMVVTNPETLNHLDDFVDKHIDSITKNNYILLTHVLETVNASVEYIIVDSWGYATNGSWSGMVGSLQRKEADIGATALFFTADRLPILDYIALTTPTRAAFLFRQPPLSYVSNIFTLPFTTSVWVASAVLVFVSAVMLYMTTVWEDRHQLKPSWVEVTMVTLGAVCQQGSPFVSHGVPGRIVMILLFIAVMFLYTSYSANIVALLQSSTTSIKTLDNLLHSHLHLGVHDIVYNRHYFKAASDPVRRAIYEKKVAPPNIPDNFMSLEEGIEKLRMGLFAFHLELSTGYLMIQKTFREDEKCGLQTIPFLQVVDPYLAVRKNTPYKEMLSVSYRKLAERGLQDRTLRHLYTRKPKCVSKGSSFVSVGIVDCYPALLVLLYGTACSLSIFVLEMLANKRNQMKRRAFLH